MKPCLALAAAFLSSLVCLDSAALTLEPLPGSTPQVTCWGCYFPRPVGVIARDTEGQPLPGVAVTFGDATGLDSLEDLDRQSRQYDVVTDASGIALTRVVTLNPSTHNVLVAMAAGAPTVSFQLDATDRRATTLLRISGEGQSAIAGGLLPQPWNVRALDASGAPVANSVIQFWAAAPGGYPGGSFEGSMFVATDAEGIATSPAIRANDIAGDGEGSAGPAIGASTDPGVAVFYSMRIELAATPGLSIVSAPPASIPMGQVAPAPFVARVAGADGEAVAGVAVSFETAASCGSFQGVSRMIVATDGSGLAASPAFVAAGPAPACPVQVRAGAYAPIAQPMHVFDPAAVTLHARTPFVLAHTNQPYQVLVDLLADGGPVEPGAVSVRAIRAHAGAPGALAAVPIALVSDGTATLDLLADRFPGSYEIELTYATASIRVPVVQLPRSH